MFIYLSKKIAIPNNINLACVSWNSEQGWIACGGENGMLKVLKLDGGQGGAPSKGGKGTASAAASTGSNLSMNQTLEGHNGAVCVSTWNENYRKLTTSDENGLIIVWMLHKGMWFEEMINNRNKSVVRDMKWTGDGQKICIVYEDGAVIVGSVDGNRLWGKELELELCHVEWSPDGRQILFGTTSGEVQLFDNQGHFLSKIPILAVPPGSGAQIVGLLWYNGNFGFVEPNCPTLAVCYDNGRVQISRDILDDEPVLIDTGMTACTMRWNTNGSVLAIAGSKDVQLPDGGSKVAHMIQFYSPFGAHLRTLKVPGNKIAGISWEGGGLRLALAVDSFIYFANIRPDYKWGYFANTLVYSFQKPERVENCVAFWDTETDERHIKYVKSLISIRAAGEHCVFATRTDDGSGQYILILCNAIGSPVDSKYIDVEPVVVAMTPFHVVVCSHDVVYVWQYRTAVAKLTSLQETSNFNEGSHLRRADGREQAFHIDQAPSLSDDPRKLRNVDTAATNDPIACVCASASVLIVARSSGTVHKYALPHITLESKHVLKCRPELIALNCTNTRLSVIDINGILTLFDLVENTQSDAMSKLPFNSGGNSNNNSNSNSNSNGEQPKDGTVADFSRKDAWDMVWSDDNPELFACMQKTLMYVFRGIHPEEPVTSYGYLCHFSDLCIKAIQIDDVMRTPEHPEKYSIVNFETKSLRDTRDLLSTVPIQEAHNFIDDNPHPRLWRILAESALEQLNFLMADKAFVKCRDYQGIQFVKRLKLLNDANKQRAEVCAYFRRFDEAESIYLKMDQKDLAVELRMRLGDWFRVVQLIQSGAGDDKLLQTSYANIGHYYADRQKWEKAYKYYSKAKDLPALVHCAYMLDDYQSLEKLVDRIPDGSDYLMDVGAKFQSVGLCSMAVSAYLKRGDPKAAIDCCVLLNQWEQAVDLAQEHKFQQIETLLTKYASHLLQKDKIFHAVELYRKAGRHTEAARLLAKLAGQAKDTGVNPLRAKQLYLLAAMEVEKYKQKTFSAAGAGADMSTAAGSTMSAQATLATLISHDAVVGGEKHLEDAWHGVEAYHFWLLSQRQLYAGDSDAAMKTALRLQEYDDVLDPKDIYSLIALSTYYSSYFGQCSKAFTRLESMEDVKEEQREKYRKLALAIFVRHAPEDPIAKKQACPGKRCEGKVNDWDVDCGECGMHFKACIISGRAVLGRDKDMVYTCTTCKHSMYESELGKYVHCPLCHASLH
jgi:WD repeat-containing protein 35